ncbi:MAG: hypothetical protein IKZ87_01570, partial [Actinomycetaceae bacterium]|nr:hypothetical protein [Actinomycetaceae bacterium]
MAGKEEIKIGGISYTVIRKALGEGGQGTVQLVEAGGEKYAIKTLQLKDETKKKNKAYNDRLRKEVKYCSSF